MSVALLEAAVIVIFVPSPEPPALMPVKGTVNVVRSTPEKFGIGSKVGGSLTAPTVNKNESLALEVPSETVTVINDVPERFGAGMIESVRLVPAPSNSRLVCGTKEVLVLVALTARNAAGVSGS